MPSPLKIIIVEDHGDLRELFIHYLEGMGYYVSGCACAEELDEQLASFECDVLLLDINLPGEDGFSIARRLRAAHPGLHIIIISARTGVQDRVRGYTEGADIYLTKPVAPAELGAAVNSIARRIEANRHLQPCLTLDLRQLTVTGPAAMVTLTPPEVLVLKALSEAAACRLDYWRLQDLLELDTDEKGKGALEVRISRLKKKLHEAGAADPAIKSLWKEGYQLCLPVKIHSPRYDD
jgi:DNA-binding response OmpR family regulator